MASFCTWSDAYDDQANTQSLDDLLRQLYETVIPDQLFHHNLLDIAEIHTVIHSSIATHGFAMSITRLPIRSCRGKTRPESTLETISTSC